MARREVSWSGGKGIGDHTGRHFDQRAGAGKSTALRRLREDLHPDQVRALYLHDTLVNPADPAAGASLECGIGASTREAGRPTRHSDERARAPGHATGSAPGRSEARQLLTRSFNRRRVIS